MATTVLESWVNDITAQPIKSVPYILAALLLAAVVSSGHSDNIPTLNPKGPFELTPIRSKKQFIASAKEMITNWFRAHPEQPVRVIGDVATVTVLPPKLANEIRNDERLSFGAFVYKSFHAHLPGFEGFREGFGDSQIVQTVIIKDLTKLLNKITEPLAEETAYAVPLLYGDNPEWTTIHMREVTLRLIARISSRVFLGTELCRNQEWLRVTREYTVTAVKAAEALRMYPVWTRYFVHWFLPECAASRALVKDARRVVEPVLAERKRRKAEGETFDDALEWMEKESKGKPYDPVISQLLLSVVAIHTTTDQTTQTMIDLVKNPEMIDALRKEIITEIGDGGWKKTTLYNLKVLDSVLKETQRLKPIGSASMRRIASADVKLSDGTFVPKNGMLAVSGHRMWDAEVYENPDKWDGFRFLNMRKTPGKENLAQFVTTSPDHFGFGHGQHACPGRFFASNELKIALVYLLMMYDWKMVEGEDPKPRVFGFSMNSDPTFKVQMRRRKEEIPLNL